VKSLLKQIIGWPLLVIGLLASVAAVGVDQRHAWAAGVSLALVLPPAIVVVWLVQRWRWSPLGCVAVVMLASFLRLLVGFGGGLCVFLLFRRALEWDPLIFWGWLLGTYLTALAVETVVLARYVTQTPRHGSEQSVPVVAPEVARPGH
jgi:hypothetical protein